MDIFLNGLSKDVQEEIKLLRYYSSKEIFQQVSIVENQVKKRKASEKYTTWNASTKVKQEEGHIKVSLVNPLILLFKRF